MRPSSRDLAMRDPALASLLGVVPGADFGIDFGDDYGFEFGDDSALQAAGAMTISPVQHAAALAQAQPPSQAAAVQAWRQMAVQNAHTSQRALMIEPNKHSTVKVERYTFSLNQSVVLGTGSALRMTGNPDTNIRPQRVTTNAPAPGFASFDELKVANVSVTVGGTADAYQFNANAVGSHLDLPTLTPANRATALGAYSGFVPPGFVGGSAYLFTVSFTGPATIVA